MIAIQNRIGGTNSLGTDPLKSQGRVLTEQGLLRNQSLQKGKKMHGPRNWLNRTYTDGGRLRRCRLRSFGLTISFKHPCPMVDISATAIARVSPKVENVRMLADYST